MMSKPITLTIGVMLSVYVVALLAFRMQDPANLSPTITAESQSPQQSDQHCNDLLQTIGAESMLASDGARNIMRDAQDRYRKECMNGQ